MSTCVYNNGINEIYFDYGNTPGYFDVRMYNNLAGAKSATIYRKRLNGRDVWTAFQSSPMHLISYSSSSGQDSYSYAAFDKEWTDMYAGATYYVYIMYDGVRYPSSGYFTAVLPDYHTGSFDLSANIGNYVNLTYSNISSNGEFADLFIYLTGKKSGATASYQYNIDSYIGRSLAQSFTLSPFRDGEDITIQVVMRDSTGLWLCGRVMELNNPYITTGTLSQSTAETTITAILASLASGRVYARTIKWYISRSSTDKGDVINTNTIPAGAATTSVTNTFSALYAGNLYYITAEVYDGNALIATFKSTATTVETAGTLSITHMEQSRCTLNLNGLDGKNSIGRLIRWYYKKNTDSVWTRIGDNTRDEDPTYRLSAGAIYATQSVGALVPGTAYNFKAEICDATSTISNYIVLGTKSASANTEETTLKAELKNATASSLSIKVTPSSGTTDYARVFELWYKRAADKYYTKYHSDTLDASKYIDSMNYTIIGLTALTGYDIKAMVKKSTGAVVEYNETSFNTLSLDSIVPEPVITDVISVLGGNTIKVYFTANHVNGAIYTIQTSLTGIDGWTNLSKTYTEIPSAVTAVDSLISMAGVNNAPCYVRIKASYTGYADKYSNVFFTRLVKQFAWSTDVTSGKNLDILYSDWNSMIACLKYISDYKGGSHSGMANVSKNSNITAAGFNTAADLAVSAGLSLSETAKGKTISAAVLQSIAAYINGGTWK